jgi:hypothetical protein
MHRYTRTKDARETESSAVPWSGRAVEPRDCYEEQKPPSDYVVATCEGISQRFGLGGSAGRRSRLETASGGVRVTAFMDEGEPAVWFVPA